MAQNANTPKEEMEDEQMTAIDFLDSVKSEFPEEESNVYAEFKNALDQFRLSRYGIVRSLQNFYSTTNFAHRIDVLELVKRSCHLFWRHTSLIRGLSDSLPNGWSIETKPGSDTVKVKTQTDIITTDDGETWRTDGKDEIAA